MFAAQQMAQMAQMAQFGGMFNSMMAMMSSPAGNQTALVATASQNRNGNNDITSNPPSSARVHEIMSDTESVRNSQVPLPRTFGDSDNIVEIVETVEMTGYVSAENNEECRQSSINAESLEEETQSALNSMGEADDIMQDLSQKLDKIQKCPPSADLSSPASTASENVDLVVDTAKSLEQLKRQQELDDEAQLERMLEREAIKKKVAAVNSKSKQLLASMSKDELLQDQIKMKLDIHHSSVDAVSKSINELQSKIIPLTSLLLKSQRTLMNHQTQMIELSAKASDLSKSLVKKREELHQLSLDVFELMQSGSDESAQKNKLKDPEPKKLEDSVLAQGKPSELFQMTLDCEGEKKAAADETPAVSAAEEDEIKFIDDEDAQLIQQLNSFDEATNVDNESEHEASSSDDDSSEHFADFPQQLGKRGSLSEEEEKEIFPLNLQSIKKHVHMQPSKHRKLA